MYTIHAGTNPTAIAASTLNAALKHDVDKDILLLLSGGSALALANHISEKNLGEHVTVTVLDERYTHDTKASNMGTLRTMPFWNTAQQARVKIIDPRPKNGESLTATADRYNDELKEWHENHPDGVAIATMGIGPDGHTSGILPHPEDTSLFSTLFEDTSRYAVGYTVSPEKNPHTERLTTTLSYLRTFIEHAIFFVGDTKKEPALKAALAQNGDLATTPARILQEMPNVHIIIPNEIDTFRLDS